MPSIYVRGTLPNNQGRTALRYKKVPTGRGARPAWVRPPFHVRFTDNRGKQVWSEAYDTLEAAQEAQAGTSDVLAAQAKGLTGKEAGDLANVGRTTVKVAVERYLDKKRTKADTTVANYTYILTEFFAWLPKPIRFIDQVNAEVLDNFKRHLEEEIKAAPKTIENKLMVVCFMLKASGVVNPSKLVEMPTIEEEEAEPYTTADLRKLFAAMTEEERIRYQFFLDTACREKEVQYATFEDVKDGKYHVRAKTWKNGSGKEQKFTVKTHCSRRIPLTRELIDLLETRKKKAPHPRWIFVNEDSRPEGHFLRKFKAIAKRAGLNCGHCRTTIKDGKYDNKHEVEVTCAQRPVCEKHYLHRLRKTCATFWHEQGIPLRTIQYYLGHKSLETTQKYLGITDESKLQEKLNARKF